MADLRIESMHGIFGVYDPFAYGKVILLSIFAYLVIINSINLIDGLRWFSRFNIFIASVFFGILFYFQVIFL
jgi:UDP-N-acetylmuramyl pentapeptide phosphotransferase/UDP-N-acetylglucosamine-1-phosphate transferase